MNVKGNRVLAILVNVIGVIALSIMSLEIGGAFIAGGLICPDICWLLKTGELIATSGHIPNVDPFTFTLQTQPSTAHPQHPFILYQWLSEFVFHNAFQAGGINALLILASWITVVAFISLPLRALVRAGCPMWSAFLAVGLAAGVSTLRWNVRPELFTGLFTSVLLIALAGFMKLPVDAARTPKRIWALISGIIALMILWANMHSGFTIGLAILLVYALAYVMDDAMNKRAITARSRALLISLGTAVLATLATPYGITLWSQLPIIYRTPMIELVDEVSPISFLEMSKTYIYWPFVLLLATICTAIVSAASAIFMDAATGESENRNWRSPLYWKSAALIVAAVIMTLSARRMIAVSTLIILFETAQMIQFTNSSSAASPASNRIWCKPISLILDAALLLFSAHAVNNMIAHHVHLTIPASSDGFKPPLNAMQYFSKNCPTGFVCASLPIADMIDFYTPPTGRLWIDSRLDLFDSDTIRKSQYVLHARPGFEKYIPPSIEWIFVRPQEPVAGALKNSTEWRTVYGDAEAVILHRALPDDAKAR